MSRPNSKMKDRKVFKVALNTLTGQTRPTTIKVFEILGKCEIFVNNIREFPKGYTALTDCQTTADKLFAPNATQALKEIFLEPIMPPPF